jgi:hypothetical protein
VWVDRCNQRNESIDREIHVANAIAGLDQRMVDDELDRLAIGNQTAAIGRGQPSQ